MRAGLARVQINSEYHMPTIWTFGIIENNNSGQSQFLTLQVQEAKVCNSKLFEKSCECTAQAAPDQETT